MKYYNKEYRRAKECGVTIVELLVVIFVIGIFIAFFTPTVVSRATNFARINATKQELNEIRSAIMGDPNVISGGEYVATGFKADLGRLPRHLIELSTRRPDTTTYNYPNKESLPLWNHFTKTGWNGPYIRDDGKQGFLYDAWGDLYDFLIVSGETLGLRSRGPDGEWNAPGTRNDDIEIRF